MDGVFAAKPRKLAHSGYICHPFNMLFDCDTNTI